MKNDIELQINGLNEEISAALAQVLTSLLQEFSSLDLRRLNKIIVTTQFEEELLGLNTRKTTTKNFHLNNKNTLAKVITLPLQQDFEMVIVMRSSYALNLLNLHKNTMAYADALHVLHHELAHVHDNNNKIDRFKTHMIQSKYQGKDSLLYPLAEICWSEYIANYLSASTAQNSLMPEMLANSLEALIGQKERNIKTEVMVYKTNPKRSDVLFSMKEDIEELLKTASYVIGYMHGMGKSLEELSYDSNYLVQSSYFHDIWAVFNEELNAMLSLYPHAWMNLNVYQDLAFGIEAFFNQMGIVLLENEKKEVYFKVM